MSTAKNRTLTIQKTFDAPLKTVWNAWTESDQLVKWWAPGGMDIKIIEHDFTEGGRWKYAMPMPNGAEFISEGVYQKIDPYKKIVTTADFKPMTENVQLVIEFEEKDGKTQFTFSVVHETEAYCKQQEEMGFYNGWGGTLTRFEKVLNPE